VSTSQRPSIAEEIDDAERRIAAAEKRLEAGRAARTQAEHALRADVERLRADFDAARERVARDVGGLNQRLDRVAADAAQAVAGEAAERERLGAELARVAEALGPIAAWREDVDRDIGRMTAELAQRAAAIDDANAAMDDLRASDRIAEITATLATVRAEQAELLAAADERDLRTDAAEGRVAAIEAAAEAFSERLHGLEADAQAAAEEARRLREAVDELRARPAAAPRPLATAPPRLEPGPPAAAPPPPEPPPPPAPGPHSPPSGAPPSLTPGGRARLVAALRGKAKPWPPRPWLPSVLRALAVDEPEVVARTAATLLEVSPLLAGRPLRFELEVEGHGTWAAGSEDATPRLRVRADPAALADLLDGSRATRARLQGRLDVDGRYGRARRHLAALGRATRSPADLARAGAWLDPVLLARALARRVDAAWLGEHRIAVAVSLAGPVAARFTVAAAGGLCVTPGDPEVAPDATVATTTMAFYRWLSGEPIDAPVTVEGEPEAVATMAGWGERALC
jgi:predicted  nucleic acid-binding Zn-ribbon protein